MGASRDYEVIFDFFVVHSASLVAGVIQKVQRLHDLIKALAVIQKVQRYHDLIKAHAVR